MRRVSLIGLALLAGSCKANINDGTVAVAATIRVSISSSGAQGGQGSGIGSAMTPTTPAVTYPMSVAVSADGRYIAFTSRAPMLAPEDTNTYSDVYRHDVLTRTTVLVSVTPAGTSAGNNVSQSPAISADGRYVAFVSKATDLVSTPAITHTHVYRRDMLLNQTVLASFNQAGNAEAGADSDFPRISADGNIVAFQSPANNIATPPFSSDGGTSWDIFARDMNAGTNFFVSVDSSATNTDMAGDCVNPAISADGNYIAWETNTAMTGASALDGDAVTDVYVRNWRAVTPVTTLASVDNAGANFAIEAHDPALSGNGRYLAFDTPAAVLASDSNATWDVYIRDLVGSTTTRGSLTWAGFEPNAITGGSTPPTRPWLSDDGRFLTFQADASNMVVGDTNLMPDVFVRDLVTGDVIRASVRTFGAQGDEDSTIPVLSGDGRFVVYASRASTLVDDDTNGVRDVFVTGPLR